MGFWNSALQLSKKIKESLEHNAFRNHLAYMKKVKCHRFKPGDEVLFAHPHQVGLVTVPSVNWKIVKKLHRDYYEIVALTPESNSKHHLALHACRLAAYYDGCCNTDACDNVHNTDTSDDVHNMNVSNHLSVSSTDDHKKEACSDSSSSTSIIKALSECADFQRHKFYSNVTCAIKDDSRSAILKSAISFMAMCDFHIEETHLLDCAIDSNTLMEIQALSLDLKVISTQASCEDLQQCCNATECTSCQYYLSGISAWNNSRFCNHCHLQQALKSNTLPVYVELQHMCCQCLDTERKCDHPCCKKWLIDTATRYELLAVGTYQETPFIKQIDEPVQEESVQVRNFHSLSSSISTRKRKRITTGVKKKLFKQSCDTKKLADPSKSLNQTYKQ